jgi:cytochrome c2
MFGPEMNQMGSKVNQEWLVSWLIDPKHYWSGTAMPSMKLNEKEATDIAVYLLSKRAPEFDAMAMPVAKSEVRDSVILEEFLGSMTQAQAQTKLASMSLADKKMFLGEKLVNHYGCYSCHAIDGFEKAPNIGPELTYEGSKDLLKFSFENLDIPQTRHDWIYTKIRTPRIWDVGKERSFASKTRMPHFGVTHEQAVAMTAIVIGYENKKVADEAMFKVDGRQEQIIAGHRQIHKHNCIGCHAMEKPDVGRGGEVLAHYPDDITLGPPKLYTQGRKTQPDWLYGYLMNTDLMIRPWLEIRMPQFQMTEKQANTYTQYFAAYDKAQFPFVGDHYAPLSSSDTAQAAKLFEALGCLTCHGVVKPGGDVSQAAPHLDNVKHRLQGAWLVDWLRNPQAIMPGTRMPSLWPSSDDSDPKAPHVATPGYFGDDAEAQMEAMRNYLFEYGGEGEKPKARPRSAPTGSKAEQARR